LAIGLAQEGESKMSEWWDGHFYAWVILPLLIFLARILDVSIGTMRFMFIARGARGAAVLTGFFESLIWLIMIGQIIQNLHNVFCYIAYAGGFAAGNYIGMRLEERLALGKVVLRIITQKPADELVAALRARRFGVTKVAAEGASGPVCVLFMVLPRADIDGAVGLSQQHNPNAFYTIEDVRRVSQGVFPLPSGRGSCKGARACYPLRR
jgi:uncharacterized protein YebE (UPF0316 family)